VSDVVSANILASQRDLDSYGVVFNVGTGLGIRVEDIANMISRHQVYIPERLGEVLHSRADITNIQQKLGWSPKVSVLDWVKKQL
jgi:nucleoside-diphosphate-sugar epimerase